MRIIEALKKTKDLYRKLDDIKEKIGKNCCDLDYETPVYEDQKREVSGWMQSYNDILKEISNLQFRIQKTNLSTEVSIDLFGKTVTKSIAEWILRRKKLIAYEQNMYKVLTDRGLREGNVQQTNGQTQTVKIRRYYDPKEKDKKLEHLLSEPSLIDSKLEIVNAVTDLLD